MEEEEGPREKDIFPDILLYLNHSFLDEYSHLGGV
jgi:hypothetical protein